MITGDLPGRGWKTAAAGVRIQRAPINNRPEVDNPPHFYAHTAAQVIESHKLQNFGRTTVDRSKRPGAVTIDSSCPARLPPASHSPVFDARSDCGTSSSAA